VSPKRAALGSWGNTNRVISQGPLTYVKYPLQDELVTKGALIRTGEHKHTRHHLSIRLRSVTSVVVNEEGEVVSKGAESS